ncbi:hypothetical protein CFP56_010611 [Quercus suber]|uniref:Uncharacterized protein n=1 Tax=Quercus suber TaxID=58331 RepID=A0AAW0L0E6_QUESU
MWQEHQPVHGMYLQSRVWTYGLFMLACLCCSSLLIGASNPVTNPEEGRMKARNKAHYSANKKNYQ